LGRGADPGDVGEDGIRLVAHRSAVLEEQAHVPLAQPVDAQLSRVQPEIACVEDEPASGPVVALVDAGVEQPVGALLPHAVVGPELRPVVRPVADAGADPAVGLGELGDRRILVLSFCDSPGARQRGG
jgi:hypothetical protein